MSEPRACQTWAMGSSNSPISSLLEVTWDVEVDLIGYFTKGYLEISLIKFELSLVVDFD